MIDTGVIHTLGFVLFNLLFVALIFGCRPSKIGSNSFTRMSVSIALPIVAIGTFFLLAEIGSNDKSATIGIDEFQIPYKDVKAGVETDTAYFVAGESHIGSDLVVKPFADQLRKLEFASDVPKPIFEVHVKRDGAETPIINLCRYNHEADSELELPGWDVRYTKSGSPLTTPESQRDCSASLEEPGDSIDVSLYRVDNLAGQTSYHERRSFTIARTDTSVRVRLHTPISVEVRECRSDRFRLFPGLPIPESASFEPEKSIRPAQLGGGGTNPLLAPLYFGDAMTASDVCGGGQSRFIWPSFAQDDWRVAGQIKRNFVPWFLVLVLAAQSAMLLVMRSPSWKLPNAELPVVLILQWFLMIRGLIGTAGLYVNPSLERANVILDAGMTYVCLPTMAVMLLMRPEQSNRMDPALMFGFCALSFAALTLAFGEGLHVVPIAYLVLTGAVALARITAKGDHSLVEWALLRLKCYSKQQLLFKFGLIAVIGALIPRAALMVLGFGLKAVSSGLPALTERVGPLPLSALYQPLLIVGFSALVLATLIQPSLQRAATILVLWAVTSILMPILLGDFGIVWIYSWPLAMVVSWLAVKWLYRNNFVTATVLASMALAPFGILAVAFYWSSQPIPQPSAETLGDHLETAVEWNSRDQVRLMRFAAPEKLELLGNRMSFEMLDQAASLEPLVRSFWGKGYLEPSLVENPIRKYQFNDNLLPIHIAWPFGRFGLLALLLAIVASAAAMIPRKASLNDVTLSDVISLTSGVTIAWAAIYMALANMNLAPFTGRNVFLLAVTSGGDAVEGLLFILLLAVGFVASGLPASIGRKQGG